MRAGVRVAIIGAGFAGICAALRLREAGIDSFVLLERADRLGGTWRDNRYPGVACDIPSHLYCFSFLPNPEFSRRFASGAEILDYLERAAEPVRDRVELGTGALNVSWDDQSAIWTVTTSRGTITAETVVLACGRLTEPKEPRATGCFDGPVRHSSRWDDELDLRGLRVAVVGTGASAVQLLPHVVEQASSVVVLQRSAPYVLPREDHAYDQDQRHMWARCPERLAALRADLFAAAEAGHAARVGHAGDLARLRATAAAHLRRQVPDVRLRELLTPHYEFGCKRALFSDDFYPSLTRRHVALEASALAAYDGGAVVAENGARHEVDAVVLATGFESAHQPYARLVRGRDGVSLSNRWAAGMRAFASLAVNGFPNLFVLDGPNASLGHNSAVLMIESQVSHVVGALQAVGPGGVLEVEAESERQYVEEMSSRSAGTVWTSGCSSWYLDSETGRQVMLWPGTAAEYEDRFGHFDPTPYRIAVHA